MKTRAKVPALSAGLLALLMAPCTLAQTAVPAAEPAVQAAAGIKPSRLVSPDELPELLGSIIQKLSISQRTSDPFGQVQDPTAPPKIVDKPRLGNRGPLPMKQTKFSDVIGRIRVDVIMPAEHRFIIGTRSFRKGDKFPLAFQRRNIEVEVVEVNASKIDFMNTETGEVASVKLKMLPPGMQPGNDGVTAPGMVVDDKNAPLQIDSPSGF